MTTMRAAVYRSFGEANDVISIEDVAVPTPAPDEVQVRVVISAVNPTDWKARRGSRPLQFDWVIPNQDGAGVITAVGENVHPDRVGQRVWTYFAAHRRRHGTAAEYTVIPERQAVPIPDGVSDELGASMGVPALTAHRALFWDGPIDGQTVLVSGGAGAVGHYAIELARYAGAARVISTVSNPDKAELARAAGADVVVDYTSGSAADSILEAAPEGVNRIIEVAFNQNAPLNAAVLAPGGTVVSYAKAGPEPVLDILPLMKGNNTLRFMMLYDVPPDALQHGIDDVTRALADGALTELPNQRFTLEETADAHIACEGGFVGKVLVAP